MAPIEVRLMNGWSVGLGKDKNPVAVQPGEVVTIESPGAPNIELEVSCNYEDDGGCVCLTDSSLKLEGERLNHPNPGLASEMDLRKDGSLIIKKPAGPVLVEIKHIPGRKSRSPK